MATTAVALVLNSGVTSMLGVVYWIAVARRYDRSDLADNAAVIATMLTLGGIAQMNLGLSIGTLLPRAGRRAGRLLADMYLSVAACSLVVYAVFLVAVRPHLGYFDRVVPGPIGVIALGAAFAVYNIFVLQDGALSALGSAAVVPVENAFFGVAKLFMVVLLAGTLPHQGVIVSWTVPAAALVVPITWYIWRRALPRHTIGPIGAVRLRHAVRPVLGDYAGYLFLISSTLALPAIAVALVGSHRAAAFSVPWMISASLDTVASNVGIASTIEKSRVRDARMLSTHQLRCIFGLVAAVTLVVVVASPLLLRLYGGSYAADGAVVLSLLVLAAPFRAVSVMVMSDARAQGDVRFIIRIQATTAAIVIGGALVFTRGGDIRGIAVAWIVAQMVAASAAMHHRRKVSATAAVASDQVLVTTAPTSRG